MNNLHLVTGYAGEEHVTSADMGSYNAAMLGNGEFVLDRGNKFAASIISNNKVKLLDGDIMMQGRHVRLLENTYVELDFENGTQGYKRIDLIVARYTKDATTGVENCNLVVIKGTPDASAASVPSHTTGDIINDHVAVNDMPLYKVPFDGLNMQPLVCLFSVLPTWYELKQTALDDIAAQWVEKEAEIDSVVNEKVATIEDRILDSKAEIDACTESNMIAGALAVKELSSKVESKVLTFTSKSISTSAWISSTAYTDYPYRAPISCPGVTSNHVPYVSLPPASADTGNFASVSLSSTNQVYIYAKEKPTATISGITVVAVKAM